MDTHKIQDIKLDNFTLIASLPDMGRVGGLVTSHIAKKLNANLATKIIVKDKPWIDQKNGIITIPQDEYKISVDTQNKIVIFQGDGQPQEPGTVIKLAQMVFSLAQKIGKIDRIISTGGYRPPQPGTGTQVYGIVTTPDILETLQKIGIKHMGDEVSSITWFNGLILSHAKNHNIPGIGLFGEIIEQDTPQYKAAGNIIKKIEELLEINIGTKELDQMTHDSNTTHYTTQNGTAAAQQPSALTTAGNGPGIG